MADRYSVVVRWSDEDQCYIAVVPEIDGLNAYGETAAAALDELEIAKRLLLEVWHERGVELPAPSKVEVYSGQVRLRMPRSLHAKLAYSAEQDGVSLNTYMVTILAESNENCAWRRQLLTNQVNLVEAATKASTSFESIYEASAKQRSTTAASVIQFTQRAVQ